jgi:hypothetical protein
LLKVKRLQRAQAQHVVDQLGGKLALFAGIELDAPLGGDVAHQLLDLGAEAFLRQRGGGGGVELRERQRAQFGELVRGGLALHERGRHDRLGCRSRGGR